tara:strand:+ start:15834 stop:16193 length:360 start_codon:yes stop_codon:yes gene_type:complete
MADLLGGVSLLVTKAREAMETNDPLRPVQLAQHVIRLQPQNKGATRLIGEALATIGERTFNAAMHNYTFTHQIAISPRRKNKEPRCNRLRAIELPSELSYSSAKGLEPCASGKRGVFGF